MEATTIKQFMRTLQILCAAFVGGQLMFALVMLLLHTTQPAASLVDEQTAQVMLLAGSIAVVAAALVGQFLFTQRLKAIGSLDPMPTKLSAYQAASILRWALWEGPSLMCIVLFHITDEYLLLAPVALILALFVINRPTKNAVGRQLQLRDDEMF